MNNLLFFMGGSASAALVFYYVLKIIFGEKLDSKYRYFLLKMVLAFYIFPIPLLAYRLRELVCFLLGNGELFVVQSDVIKENLKKIYYVTDLGVIIPRYGVIFWGAFTIWLIVFSSMLFRYLCQYRKVRKVVQENSVSADFVAGFLDEELKAYVENRNIKIMVCSNLASSFTYGLFKPVISMTELDNPTDMILIAKHELMHVKSIDFLVRILGLFAIAIHFYNPFAYLLFIEMNNVAELYCDSKVLMNVNDEVRLRYGHLVIKNASAKSGISIISHFSINNKIIFKERIMMIKNKNPKKVYVFIISILMTFVVGTLPVLAYNPPCVVNEPDFESDDLDTDTIEGGWGEFILPEDEAMFEKTDSYFITEEGEIIIETDLNPAPRLLCSHNYRSYTYKKHIPQQKGSCKVKTYSCKRCRKCGGKIDIELISSTLYKKCPH